MSPAITVSPTPAALAVHAAAQIADRARQSIAARNRFLFVLTGGSTPEKTYEKLAADSAMPFPNTFIFMGDERYVPHADPRSNFGMARRSMLDRVQIPPSQILPITTDLSTPDTAARAYEKTLQNFFAAKSLAAPPAFDLLLLGLGDDGHIASLFPGHPTLVITDRWVISSPPGTLPPPVDRVTMTYPLINAAREVMFLVAGQNKAAAIRDILDLHLPKTQRPATGVTAHRITWLIDAAAASLLKSDTLKKAQTLA